MSTASSSPDRVTFQLDEASEGFTGERYLPGVRGQLRFEHLHRYLLAMSFAAGRDVLDVASGEGYGSASLASVARSVIGIDADAGVVERAEARYGGKNLAFHAGSLERLPCESGKFDLAVCFETIEHVRDARQAVRELRRVLRPDGLLLMSTPDRLAQDGALHEADPFHTQEFSVQEFRALLAAEFPYLALAEQRFVHGSLIVESDGVPGSPRSAYGTANDRDYRRSATGIGSSYSIAIAGASPLPAIGVHLLDAGFEWQGVANDLRHAVGHMRDLEKQVAELRIQVQLRDIQLASLRQSRG